MTNRLLTVEEIYAELGRLVEQAKVTLVCQVDDRCVSVGHTRVELTTSDRILPMTQFSERILAPLVNYASNAVQRPEDVRGSTHGPYDRVVVTAQNVKIGLRAGNEANFGRMTPIFPETLDMISHKLARIATGDFEFEDHWRDVAGYANLVLRELERRKYNREHVPNA